MGSSITVHMLLVHASYVSKIAAWRATDRPLINTQLMHPLPSLIALNLMSILIYRATSADLLGLSENAGKWNTTEDIIIIFPKKFILAVLKRKISKKYWF